MVPPQFTTFRWPFRSQQTVSAISGAPVSTYCNRSAEPLRKEFGTPLLLPCTKRQLSTRRTGRVLVFVIAFISITLPLFLNKVNGFFKITTRKTALFSNKNHPFVDCDYFSLCAQVFLVQKHCSSTNRLNSIELRRLMCWFYIPYSSKVYPRSCASSRRFTVSQSSDSKSAFSSSSLHPRYLSASLLLSATR